MNIQIIKNCLEQSIAKQNQKTFMNIYLLSEKNNPNITKKLSKYIDEVIKQNKYIGKMKTL